MASGTVEARTREIGREIFRHALSQQPTIASAQWWDERLMALSMKDEALKVQLFRFVDALPALGGTQQINRHLREYIGQVSSRLPALARPMIRWLPDDGALGGFVARAARLSTNRLARRFIAGSNLPETIATLEALRRQRMGFTVDLLGEAVLSELEAQQYQRAYLQFTDGLSRRAERWDSIPQVDCDHAGPIPRVNISIKLSSLYSQFDPIDPEHTSRAVRERLRPILRLARQRRAFVNIDMEQFAYKDLTLRIFEEVFSEQEFRDWPHVGIAIQAYLKSCGEDLRRLAAFIERRGTPAWVRLVKGAYWDYELVVAQQQNWRVPVFTRKAESDANFEAQCRFLIERNDVLRLATGSHNVRSIAHAMALAEHLRLSPRNLEFQMLYGMADPIKAALVAMGQRVRIYTPFGQLLPGMAYLVRRLLENTSNQSFLRAGFLEHAPVEELLMNPAEVSAHNGQARPLQPSSTSAHPVFRNEPLSDFSQEAARQEMERALQSVAAQLGQSCELFIGGRHVKTAAELESINPSHKTQVVGRFSRATAADAERAIDAASSAFDAWRQQSVSQRAELLFRSAAILRRRRFDLAAWEVFECGKPWREADADIAEAIDFCNYYAIEMLKLAEPQRRDVGGEENEYFYEPRGVAAIIAPWNFPLAILCGMTAAALVTGNTAIMKPAEQSSIVASKLMEVFVEAGFPPGVVNFLTGVGEEVGPVLVNSPKVAIIAFTGSRSVGLEIHRQASEVRPGQEQIKRVIAELGGKNAIIVDEDADLDEAVHGVAASAFGYAGQKCSACSRAIVLRARYEAFLGRLIEQTRSLRVAPAEDPGCFVGPVIDGEAYARILKQIERGKKEAKLVYPAGPHPPAIDSMAVPPASQPTRKAEVMEEGYFIQPHIFADVSPQAAIAQEEVFGPVLAVIPAADLTEALRIANASKYALTGGLFSRSPRNIERVRREFRVGNLYINRKITGALVDRQPFGGFKMSGIGSKAGGPDYLVQFMIPRTVTENTLRHGFAPTIPVSDAVAGE